MRQILSMLLAYGLISHVTVAQEPSISAGRADEHGILIHDVASPFQSGATKIRILLPNPLVPKRRYPVIYVLPVEAGTEHRYGDGLLEVKRQQLNERFAAIFVAPTFSQLPWYADHPSDPVVRQESHLLQVVVPFVDQSYPTKSNPAGRLLLGFSKSGWGAWSLLLRHGDTFSRAVAWDAPLQMHAPGKYGSGPIFGTQQNFEHYHVAQLLRTRAVELRDSNGLILLGWGGFRDDLQQTHALLEQLQIPHRYSDGPQRKHDWHSGWVLEGVQLLMSE